MERIHLDPNARAGNISKRSSIKSNPGKTSGNQYEMVHELVHFHEQHGAP
jgi:hypothetical protein